MAGQDDSRTSDDETSPNTKNSELTEENDGSITEEYDVLDLKLDELNSALDFLEQKNEDIHNKLKELLQSNRAIREELKNENAPKNIDN